MEQIDFQANVSQFVAIIDLLLAVATLFVATFQFAKGSNLITSTLTDTEKLTRLIFYSSLIYVFLILQVAMGLKLLRAARDMIQQPIDAIRVFGWWREWSVVFFLTLILHTIVVTILMTYSSTKLICLVTLLFQSFFRPVGIVLIGKFKQNLEFELPTKI